MRISPRAGAWALVVLTAASITAAIFAFAERNNAQPVGESRALAGEALAAFGNSELDRGLLLSLQSYSISPTVQARASLVQGLEDAGDVVRFLHVPLSATVAELDHPYGSVTGLAFSPDGKTLTARAGGKAYRWYVAGGLRAGKPPARGGVAIGPDGRRLIATAGSSQTLRRSVALWNAKQSVGRAFDEATTSPVVSPDGKVVAVGTLGGTVLRWDVTSRLVAAPALGGLVDPAAATTKIAFSPDSELLAAADSAGTVTVFDLAASLLARLTPASPLGQKTPPGCGVSAGAALAGQQSPKGQPAECGYCAEPCAYAVSPNGGVTAVAVQGEEAGPDVFLWNSQTRQVLAHLRIADPAVNAVQGISFSPDGETLAVSAGGVLGPADETVTLWDVATGMQLGRPLVGLTGGGPIKFSPDGQSLSQFGGKGTLTWSLPLSRSIGAVRARVCDLVGRNLTRAEWQQFLPGQSYQKTCPQWPTRTS